MEPMTLDRSKSFLTASYFSYVLLAIAFFAGVSLRAQDAVVGDPKSGKKLFNTNCAACHTLDRKVIGPALRDVTKRRSKDWLTLWIKDNATFRASGDADATAIFEEYSGSVMSAFPFLSDKDIDDLLAYTENPPKKKAVSAASDQGAGTSSGGAEVSIHWSWYFALACALLYILYVLVRIKGALRKRLSDGASSSFSQEVDAFIRSIFSNRYVLVGLVLFLVFCGVKSCWDGALSLGVDQGYQPVQPIAFSHKVHAGDNKIDCKYCHSGVRTSKTAGIPSVNVCMNCHKYIQEGTLTGKKEIDKIYQAIGFDPTTSTYIDGYDRKAVKWVRIHRLQDFVYFNHSQHVEVAGLECAKCHGPVDKMDEVYQFSELTMGWCVECHRTTEVKMKGNPYYEKIHSQLAKKYGTEKVTVDMMGGLECGKCHY